MKLDEWCAAYPTLVDNRKAVVCAVAKALPGGDWGLCLLSIQNHTLFVHAADPAVGFPHVTDLLFEIPLSAITIKKKSSFVFNRCLHFEYKGFLFKFADFGNAKYFLSILTEEAEKK